jgi:hypothetical protein
MTQLVKTPDRRAIARLCVTNQSRAVSQRTDVPNRQWPISFNWKDGGSVTSAGGRCREDRSAAGYLQQAGPGKANTIINVVLVNAIKEQQQQINAQQKQIEITSRTQTATTTRRTAPAKATKSIV